jgi:hypothetical protein
MFTTTKAGDDGVVYSGACGCDVVEHLALVSNLKSADVNNREIVIPTNIGFNRFYIILLLILIFINIIYYLFI